MPQTLRNIDKAIGKIVLAGGENIEARIKGNTATAKAKNKINVDGLFRTEEEKRKFENRAATTKAALEDMDANPTTADAQAEIDDDWLNFFVRISEDKSSEELQQLFGRILSGEIRRPGSFSLRTVQLMSTISKQDAEALSYLLSYAINETLPFQTGANDRPTIHDRLFLAELGVAGYGSPISAMQKNCNVQPGVKAILPASHLAILVENNTQYSVKFSLSGQALNTSAHELVKIANSPPTDLLFLKNVAKEIHTELRQRHASDMDSKRPTIHGITIAPDGVDQVRYNIIYTEAG
jgi:hypothetical protein